MDIQEPSVLDYVKALLTPWKGKIPPIPPEEKGEDHNVLLKDIEQIEPEAPPSVEVVTTSTSETTEDTTSQIIVWNWRSLAALGLALAAQRSLEPSIDRMWVPGAVLYMFAAIMALWAFWSGEWSLPNVPKEDFRKERLTIRQVPLWISLPLVLLAFLMFGGNRFTGLNLLVWLAALVAIISAFWIIEPERVGWLQRLLVQIRRPQWTFNLTPWTLLLLSAVVLSIFFRTFQLTEVPPEMTSDHAEKLLDVSDILRGEASIFFVRNTGREPLQMYLTAMVAKVFGTGLSFNSLKIGTILAGLLTLPFIYLLGVELANQRTALLASTFAGIAYWPNVISRASLRFTLYPLFVAATLYFLIRGIRRSSMNDFLIAGIMLGIGLHGYSPIRVLPIVVVIAVGIYMIHRHSIGQRQITLWRLLILATVALVIFLPLLRYWVSNPDMFTFRALTRMTSLERTIPGAPLEIFLQNLWNALIMFSWDNGRVWLVSVMGRPALDVVSGALFHLGVIILLLRYIRRRHWVDLFLLLAVPLLMMPSILSLAFPEENPVLNRTSGALVVVFLIVGIALDSLLSTLKIGLKSPAGTRLMGGLVLVLLAWSAFQNYDLVFNQYQNNYAASAWNTSELGSVIRNFSDSIGSADSAYVVPYPHWVDTRLVGINAGYPSKDYALWPHQFAETISETRAKLFLINLNDQESVDALQQLYPQGWINRFISRYPNKAFYIFVVPPQESRSEIPAHNEVIID
jgi:hypothetical protein